MAGEVSTGVGAVSTTGWGVDSANWNSIGSAGMMLGQIVSTVGTMVATGIQLDMQKSNIAYQIKTAEDDKNLQFADMDSKVALTQELSSIQKAGHKEIENLAEKKGKLEEERVSIKTLDNLERTSTLDTAKLHRQYAGMLRDAYGYGRPR